MSALWKSLAFLLSMTLMLTACTPPPVSADITVAQSNKPRIANPQILPSDTEQLVNGNTAFALEVYRRLTGEDGNIVFSPYSISVALAMTYAGAEGNTEKQMAQALFFLLPPEKLHPAFNALDQKLNNQPKPIEGTKPFVLRISNALWGQKEYPFLAAFLDMLAENYGAGMRLLDFAADPEAARLQINQWISEQTEGKIKDLIPPGAIDVLTRLVLTNAIYFNADWQLKFDKDATYTAPFNRLDGSTVSVDMMNQEKGFRYAAMDGYQAIKLAYQNSTFSMLILVPDAGKFSQFESSLSPDELAAVLARLEYTQVNLSLPKFQYEFDFSVVETLKAMGMQDAFIPNAADFSGMDGSRDLFITDILHKAFIAVDEAGTEAAAATAVIVGVTSMPPEAIPLVIDRPFLYLIQDDVTGTILFLGRVLDPTQK